MSGWNGKGQDRETSGGHVGWLVGVCVPPCSALHTLVFPQGAYMVVAGAALRRGISSSDVVQIHAAIFHWERS